MISGKIFASLISGIAAGAAIGMLFAPYNGKESRKRIYKKGDEFIDELDKKFQGLNRELKDQYKSVWKEVNQKNR